MHLTILESASAQCAASIVPVTGRHPMRCSHLRLHRQMSVRTVVAAGGSTEGADQEGQGQQAEAESPSAVRRRLEAQQQRQQKQRRRQADSTDWFASTLTRRFGLAGGLAWLGFLSFGVISEQIKTRLEVAADEKGTQEVKDAQEVVLPSGVRYTDIITGGGQHASPGLLMILELKLKANGALVADTAATGKPLVVITGRRPLTGGLSPGAEEALFSMRAGGKRRVFVPARQGFGEKGGVLRATEHVPDKEGVIPPNADLEYELQLVRVSVPP